MGILRSLMAEDRGDGCWPEYPATGRLRPPSILPQMAPPPFIRPAEDGHPMPYPTLVHVCDVSFPK
jgi:hypothetical protein